MTFASQAFLLGVLPLLLALYYIVMSVAGIGPRARRGALFCGAVLLLGSAVFVISRQPFPGLVLGAAIGTLLVSAMVDGVKARSLRNAQALLALIVAGNIGVFIAVRLQSGPSLEPLAAGVVTFLAIAFAFDVFRGEAATDRPLTATVALLPLPLLVAGPIVRYRDFRAQLAGPHVGMGPFTYGVRRFATGLLKVTLVASVLNAPVQAIFAAPPDVLTLDAAWLGALAFSLQLYFQLSGWADVAIGLGRMLGLRIPENFRRPYTADSVRDFWRRWNITLMTGLRDYLYLPIAGRQNPTLRLFANLVLGFCLMGLWHGAGWTVLLWGIYAGLWLALEEIGLGAWIARMPRLLRHVYVLLIVAIGWVLLRSENVAAALGFLGTMAGVSGAAGATAHLYLTTGSWIALGVAIIGAGPLIPSVSRWRVSVDAATISLLMMLGATGVFVWRGVTALRPSRARR
ncbi:MAG: MBOAT family O-acyltransferase [Vicinamibacterales bacterium]